MSDFSVTFLVSSGSAEKLRAVKAVATEKSSLDRVHTDIAKAADTLFVEAHKLRDYFNSISLAEQDQTSFRLIFKPRHDAGRFWKDLIVEILTALRNSGASIQTVARGQPATPP